MVGLNDEEVRIFRVSTVVFIVVRDEADALADVEDKGRSGGESDCCFSVCRQMCSLIVAASSPVVNFDVLEFFPFLFSSFLLVFPSFSSLTVFTSYANLRYQVRMSDSLAVSFSQVQQTSSVLDFSRSSVTFPTINLVSQSLNRKMTPE